MEAIWFAKIFSHRLYFYSIDCLFCYVEASQFDVILFVDFQYHEAFFQCFFLGMLHFQYFLALSFQFILSGFLCVV